MTFFLTRWFYALMQFLYGLFSNSYLLTILVATLLLRLVQIYPDISNRKTQIKMAVVKPELDSIQKRYADDPQKMRAEQSKIMKKHGISTFSSCLPMLLIFPLFFCFLGAFRCWGNEETVTLMYETAVARNYEEGTPERAAAEEQAMETFKGFKFLWVNNIWQPDCFIDAQFLLFRFDGEVVTKPRNLQALSSVALANMPLLQKGYTDKSGKFVSGQEIWQTLCDAGLASGEYGNAGNSSGCNSCSSCATDRSGMYLLPEGVSEETASKYLNEEEMTPAEGEEAKTYSGADIYRSIMKRYPDALSKDGKTPANGLMIMPFLAFAMQMASTLIMLKRNKKDGQAEQAKQMNAMMYFMPVMTILICMSTTTAFSFYWTISGAIQLVSTLIINAVFDKKKAETKAA
ncbi:MAG: YidC/Oxa1 family membrane protein insertase [Clostridiales bacterium]|nr:YidC/Oxa1 family membrane protein insertase [Clostridiales bacterium]